MSFANIVLSGHLGAEPELSYTTNDTAVLRFSIAVNTGYKDRKTCSWYKCVMFGKQAEALRQHLGKGKAVIVAGEPSISTFTNDSGVKFTNVDVQVNSLSFVGGNNGNSGGNSSSGSAETLPFADSDDDIPF